MAFCSKCGTALQADDEFCGKCGAPISAPAAAQAPQQMDSQTVVTCGCVLIVILGLILLGIGKCYKSMLEAKPYDSASTSDDTSNSEPTITDPVRGPKPKPSEWDGLTPPVKEYFDQTLNDASSLEIIECSPVIELPSHWGQRVKYRAANAFGGKVLKEQVFLIKDGSVVGVQDY